MGSHPGDGLLERELEVARLDAAVARAADGVGGLVLVEGPAGIGKSRLLAGLRDGAGARGLTVLAARAGELEREFGFGVVRQLLEPAVAAAPAERRAAWLSGAAALAEPLVSGLEAPAAAPEDSAYPLLHGLYWLCANMATDGPLVLAVDDLQWADRPSLDFLGFLARRLDTLPVLLAAATRPPDADGAGVAALLADPAADVLRPEALSGDAVADRIRDVLGQHAEAAFCEAFHEITAGNPLLVDELLREVRAEQIAPVAAQADRVRRLGPRGVSTVVLLRIARLPQGAAELARAVAVLGDGADVALAAQLAGLSEPAAGDLASALVRADVLTSAFGLGFVHPVVRTAIYEDLPALDRSRAHATAARLLSDRGADAESMAAHLLVTAPAGEQWVAEALQRAATRAVSLGAIDAACHYLERALAEPPGDERRPAVLAALGSAEARVGSPQAVERLEQALAVAPGPCEHAEVALTLAAMLKYRGGGVRAVEVLREARCVCEQEEHYAERIDVELVGSGLISLEANALLREELAGLHAPDGDPASFRDRFALAALAFLDSAAGRDAQRAIDLARRALAGRAVPMDPAAGGHLFALAGVALMFADDLDEAGRVFTGGIEEARRHGAVFGYSAASATRALISYRVGDLRDAVADALAVIEMTQQHQATGAMLPLAQATLGFVSLEAELPNGVDLGALMDEDHGQQDALPYTQVLLARGLVRADRGDLTGGLADVLAAGRRDASWGAVSSGVTPWRPAAVLLHLRLDQQEQARTLAAEEVELARASGAQRSLGVALATAGLAQGGEQGVELLREAVEVLRGAPARLELARALTDLGAALRRAGDRRAARDPLGRGRELAEQCGATRLAERARQELLASGARPRRTALAGVSSLTPSERRVVEMAAEGMTNRDIAQALFVTEKTVETHLGHAYGKLGIRGRRELPQALEGAAAA